MLWPPIRQRGRIVQHAINHIFVLFGGKFCGAQRIFPQELRHLLEAHTVAVVGGVLPILVQHHHIRNRQRVSLEICRIVHIECAVDVLQRGASSQRRGVHLRIVGLIHGQTGSLQAVVGLKTVIAGGIFIAQLVDTWMFFKYFVKAWVAIYLVSNTFTITMAVFDVGQSVVNSASGIINGETAIDVSSLSMQMQAAMATMEIGELVVLALETFLVSFCMKIMSVVITVIVYGRMIEIYLYTSLAPIPFATMSNREWGHVGTNYFRGLFALAFQAFLMMVCVAIYAALISSVRISSNMHSALIGVAAYTVILCFSLMKTGSLSKQIFGSH